MRKVALVFGCGGHRAQANRFYNQFSPIDDLVFFGITDEGRCPTWCDDFLVLEELRDKYTGKNISIFRVVCNIYLAYRFIKKKKITSIVSFGPGVAIFVAVAAKITGCSIIHFETWSKFHTPTKTTKVMRYLTKNIFIQNIELKDSIPYGKYIGRF